MAYKIRIILDVKEDVIRDVVVSNSSDLEQLHFLIAKSMGFNGQEMAAFYLTDNEWNQGDEIPLFDMSELGNGLSMKSCIISETIPNVGDKLIYVYDFFKMWTFFIEVLAVNSEKASCTNPVLFSFGDAPEKAPEKEFIAENDLDAFNGFNESDEFDNFEDFDVDNY
jgi:hypothetical protein